MAPDSSMLARSCPPKKENHPASDHTVSSPDLDFGGTAVAACEAPGRWNALARPGASPKEAQSCSSQITSEPSHSPNTARRPAVTGDGSHKRDVTSQHVPPTLGGSVDTVQSRYGAVPFRSPGHAQPRISRGQAVATKWPPGRTAIPTSICS